MPLDLWSLYSLMLKSRLFEEAVTQLWHEGLISGKLAALVLETGSAVKFGRVCTQTTIPYARHLEDEVLPNIARICTVAREVMAQ